jgi:hypothetical protein
MKTSTLKTKVPIKKEKTVDAVKMMREIRDKMSKDIKGMTFEEETEYLEKIISSKNSK